MAAGQGFKTFTTGEVLTAADVNGYLMQGINVFASSAARSAAITSPQEGQYSFLKDTNALEYYDGAAWVGAPVGDITAVTAGKGLTGGGSSGDVTVALGTTAKGDLVAGSGASTAAVLTVGSDGETLVADSSTSVGLRYQSGYNGNAIINGGMDVWQRGTSITGTSGVPYTADRWQATRAGATGYTITRQVTGDTTNLPNIQYCLRAQRDSGNTNTSYVGVFYSVETADSIRFAGQTATLSFWMRKGANYSQASSQITVEFSQGTGTDQNIISGGFTGKTNVGASTPTLTTTWQRFTITGTVATSTTQLGLQFYYNTVGTAGAADYFEITGVQVELGSVPTIFKRSAAGGGSIQGELAACRRYLPAFTGSNFLAYIGYSYATNNTLYVLPFDVPARVAPTGITVTGTCNAFALNAGTAVTPTFDSSGLYSGAVLAAQTITAGQGSRLQIPSGSSILFTGCEL